MALACLNNMYATPPAVCRWTRHNFQPPSSKCVVAAAAGCVVPGPGGPAPAPPPRSSPVPEPLRLRVDHRRLFVEVRNGVLQPPCDRGGEHNGEDFRSAAAAMRVGRRRAEAWEGTAPTGAAAGSHRCRASGWRASSPSSPPSRRRPRRRPRASRSPPAPPLPRAGRTNSTRTAGARSRCSCGGGDFPGEAVRQAERSSVRQRRAQSGGGGAACRGRPAHAHERPQPLLPRVLFLVALLRQVPLHVPGGAAERRNGGGAESRLPGEEVTRTHEAAASGAEAEGGSQAAPRARPVVPTPGVPGGLRMAFPATSKRTTT